MKTYLLAMYQPEGPVPTAEQLEPVMRELGAITQDMADTGALVFNGGLFPPGAATTVRHQAGIGPVDGSFAGGRVEDTMLTDGPFLEGKEYLGGLWIIRVPDLDDALAYGRRITAATTLPMEVRPFQG
ncbi:MAG TPA: YciI family protein [Actinoplanes sp.]|nr:YciI family protein [Actinoplanes sp.]